ncbi:MAG TPA: SDR family NAD(P)-dependent oxidoreductase [Terracidiphilus sp.]|nr:SDR family NAD(P)-dependent oxidoreductase [Terracidiphilus sp.]
MADSSPKRFAGKVVLVAGGAGGLGRAVSLAFLAEGAQVVVPYRRQSEMDALAKLAGDAASLEGHVLDLSDSAAVTNLVEGILASHSHLDILVNTVGAWAGGAKFWQADAGEFDRMLALNLRTGYSLLRAVLPPMLQQGSGAIVNIASRAAVDHAGSAAGYVASKAAAVAMIDSLAADLKGTGVRANSVLPGIIDTEANRQAMPNADFAKWPKPEAIARVILFLCSEDALLINAASIPVYGDA